MFEKFRTPSIFVLIFATWILLFFVLFQLASENQGSSFFVLGILPIALSSAGAIWLAQNSKHILFLTTIASLIFTLLIVASPFISFLRPIGNTAIAIVNKTTLLVTGKTPYELSHPAATAEAWVARAKEPKTGKKLNFLEFPKIAYWSQVCIFPGHTTDAQFASILPYPSEWKLSDKSKATTQKEFFAIVFADSATKKIIHVYDIAKSSIDFDPKLFKKCMDRNKAQLRRTKEATLESGPLFTK